MEKIHAGIGLWRGVCDTTQPQEAIILHSQGLPGGGGVGVQGAVFLGIIGVALFVEGAAQLPCLINRALSAPSFGSSDFS